MAAVRSPNYPSLPLGAALEAMRPAFKNENRNRMSRSVLAKHLGYSSLNGRALGKIGAVRAYGLVDGAGDELRVSDDAVTALMAPTGSPVRDAALMRLAQRPSLFQELRKSFPDSLPSIDNLKFSLIQRGFTPDAAEKAAKNYLSTMSLVAGVPDSYNPPEEEDDDMGAPEVSLSEPKRQIAPKPTGLHAEAGGLVRTAKFPLAEGDATLTFPATLSSESLELLRSFIDLTVRQMELAKKAASVLYPPTLLEKRGRWSLAKADAATPSGFLWYVEEQRGPNDTAKQEFSTEADARAHFERQSAN